MKRYKFSVFIFILVLSFIIFTSYIIYSYGITNKLKGELESYTYVNKTPVFSDLPKISIVINSSGEEYTNSDVALIVNVEGKNKLSKLEYSFDLKNWKVIKKNINKNNYQDKIVFNKTMNKTVFIRAIDIKGYKSYSYNTKVLIDKDNPKVHLSGGILTSSDNNEITFIQFSNDLKTWNEKKVNKKNIILNVNDYEYKYYRTVDKVGNISKVVNK